MILRRTFAVACVMLLSTGGLRSTVLIVDPDGGGDFTSVQAAIDAAVPGQDEVFVRCGRYREHILIDKQLRVRGANPACAILEGVVDEAVVRVEGAPADTVFSGFTVRNGSSIGNGPLRGGGVHVRDGFPVITANVIEQNGPTNVFNGNIFGGGVYVVSNSVPPSRPVITGNVIRDNRAFGGGGVYSFGPVEITNNLIVDNYGSFGGGLEAGGADTMIGNNTILRNRADYGGALFAYQPGGVVANNIIAQNQATLYYDDFFFVGSQPEFRTNLLFGQPSALFPVDPENQVADPMLQDEAGNVFASVQPRTGSPAIDGGTPDANLGVDLRGIPRPLDGDADGTAVIDIGAREHEGVTGLVHDGSVFLWDTAGTPGFAVNVYRGSLAGLKASGEYTQDPAQSVPAEHFCGLAGQLVDPAEPLAGEAFFYLVARVGVVEGSLGFDGSLEERVTTRPCQP